MHKRPSSRVNLGILTLRIISPFAHCAYHDPLVVNQPRSNVPVVVKVKFNAYMDRRRVLDVCRGKNPTQSAQSVFPAQRVRFVPIA